MDLGEVVCKNRDWIELHQIRAYFPAFMRMGLNL
jgi:hypothetical protein